MSEDDKISGIYTICPKCKFKTFNFFMTGKELISEFVTDLNWLIQQGMADDSEEETFTLIKKWEEKLK